jgi:hypothetical protein
MRTLLSIWLIGILAFPAFHSCSTLEKASLHGLTSDQYKMVHEGKAQDVYVDVTDESIDIYPSTAKIPGKVPYRSVPLKGHDSLLAVPLQLKKQGLDIDITSILMKYRPSVQGLPSQLTTDINVALYAGWRFDSYKITHRTDPLGKRSHKVQNFGYDFGFFLGPGATPVTPSTTNNATANEYSGMIIQAGFAGFLESNIASFGIAVGMDHLMNRDRKIWIYNGKPWIGFIVGIALN